MVIVVNNSNWILRLRDIIITTPDIHAVTIRARDADRGKYILCQIQRNAKSGRISRPSSNYVGVTIKSWERASDIYHTIESDWITDREVNIPIRRLAKKLGAIDILRVRDEDLSETRWIFKPIKLWHKDYQK